MNKNIKTILILLPLVAVLVLFTEYFSLFERTKIIGNKKEGNIEVIIDRSTADEAAGLIQSKDFPGLSDLVDDSGLLIKPYYTSDVRQGRFLTKNMVQSFFSDTAVREWGIQDGSGLPLKMTNAQYFKKYIYPQDFIKLGKVSINKSLINGNTLPLDQVLSDLYPNTKVNYVEYYIPVIDSRYEGMDWVSLALVFENISGKWKLVGILHNEWTI